MKYNLVVFFFFVLFGCILRPIAKADSNSKQETVYAVQKLRSLARFYMAFGEYERALPILEEAYHSLQEENLFLERQYSLCLADLAFINYQLKNFEVALYFCKESLDIQMKLNGNDHVDIAYTLRLLSDIYAEINQVDQAIETSELSFKIINLYYPNNSYLLIPFMLQKADLLFKKNRISDAEKIYLAYLPEVKKYYGSKNLYTSVLLTKLGMVYLTKKNYGEAKNMFQESLRIQYDVYGGYHRSMNQCLDALTKVYYAEQNWPEDDPEISLFRRTNDSNLLIADPPHLSEKLLSSTIGEK